jgi:gamma-glutamylputrescine oxidase
MSKALHIDSWYAVSAGQHPDFPELSGNDLRVDVCVLGAGITGLSTAIHLADRGYKVAVLEGKCVGWGASGRSGGQMIFGFASDQSKLVGLVGREKARLLWDCSLEGITLLRQLVARFNIRCDLLQGHIHAALKPRQAAVLRDWQADLENNYGYRSLTFLDKQQMRDRVASQRYVAGLHDSNSGHLHPLNYTLGLAGGAQSLGVRIFENSEVVNVSPGTPVSVQTAQGQVTADFLVLAGNAYLSELIPGIENKVMPVGTYIGASQPLGPERCRALITDNAAVADINFVLDYFRCSSDHRMLFGGRVSYSTLPPPNLKETMRKRMVAVFPQLHDVNMEYAWGGFVAITVNRAPHFGRLGGNIYFAHGFSGHGIAAGGLAGKLMAEAIQGTAEKFDVFCKIPHADFPGGRTFRTPALVLAMTWFRLRDLLP